MTANLSESLHGGMGFSHTTEADYYATRKLYSNLSGSHSYSIIAWLDVDGEVKLTGANSSEEDLSEW